MTDNLVESMTVVLRATRVSIHMFIWRTFYNESRFIRIKILVNSNRAYGKSTLQTIRWNQTWRWMS